MHGRSSARYVSIERRLREERLRAVLQQKKQEVREIKQKIYIHKGFSCSSYYTENIL